jgi:hypothetical protein
MSIRIANSNAFAAVLTFCMLLGFSPLATAQVSIGIGLPSVRIGINVPLFPNLVPVPGYPVYYDPRLDSNLFFYDGLYWVYAEDNWYASSWYNGPWDLISPEMVPDFVLRVPLRFYHRPPPYFLGWDREAPPRWGEHWGRDWDERRRGWDHWDRASIPERAPLPVYQREYARDRYPSTERQRELRDRNYHYQPRDEVARRHFEPAPDHAREPHRPPSEHQHPMVPPSGDSRQSADRSPAVERRRVPSPPGRATSDGQHVQSDHRPPVEHGQPDRRAPIERGRPDVPSPDNRRGNPPRPADRPPASERRGAPSPPARNTIQAPHTQPDHRDAQRAAPASQPQQHRRTQEPARDSPPSQPRNDKPLP